MGRRAGAASAIKPLAAIGINAPRRLSFKSCPPIADHLIARVLNLLQPVSALKAREVTQKAPGEEVNA